MRKTLTLSLLALAGALITNGQNITLLKNGEMYGGYMPQCMSDNGKYIGGSTFAWLMFMSEWQDQNTIVFTQELGSSWGNYGAEIRAISNNGIGVGYDDHGPVMIDFSTGEYGLLRATAPGSPRMGMPNDITADGSMIVGIGSAGGSMSPAYMIDGMVYLLPKPTEEDLSFVPDGMRASFVSADGSVIVGSVTDRLSTYPMIYWTRNEDGSYQLHTACQGLFENGTGNNPYFKFHPMALSPDGKKVVLNVQENLGARRGPNLLAIYDIATETFDVVTIDGKHGIPQGSTCEVWFDGISDTGVVVGWYTTEAKDRLPFIMYPDEMQPIPLEQAFPEIEILNEFVNDAAECPLSGISADGQYITGMGYIYNDKVKSYIYQGFVIDTLGDPNADPEPDDPNEGAVDYITTDGTSPNYFSVDGMRRMKPERGINILRYPDGSTKKVFIK